MNYILLRTITLTLFCSFGSLIFAQSIYPSLSPKGKIEQTIGNTQIKVTYERPAVRNRLIFGGLVPFNKVWRTGAGHSTTIAFDQPVFINDKKIPAGAYSIFTIPNPTEWTIILNQDTSLYGAYGYEVSKDVIRVKSTVTNTTRYYESFTMDIDFVPNNAKIFLSWANTQVSFEVKTSTDELAINHIYEKVFDQELADFEAYNDAADYLYISDYKLRDAITLINKALSLKQTEYNWYLKMLLHQKLFEYEKALAAATDMKQYLEKERPYDEKDVLLSIQQADREINKLDSILSIRYIKSDNGLSYRKLKEGHSKVVKSGDTIKIHETTSYLSGKLIFSSREHVGPSLKFIVGANQVIEGVEQGVIGMKEGEIRELIVPPALSKREVYPSSISPDSTLLYRVEIVDIMENER